MSAWIPVSECQPPTDRAVILAFRRDGGGVIIDLGFYDGDRYRVDPRGRGAIPVDATHWQPLPAPPAAVEDRDPRPYYAIIERSRNQEAVARYAFGPVEKIKRGIGDPHFPALLFTLADIGVLSPDSPRVICPTCEQVVTPISGAADVPR